ncbi:MAG: methyltransferase domain-containing protein [Chloroflexi bacterium]|nr:methyltransferase domain-containing protein [Chloroflexota bacterium]
MDWVQLNRDFYNSFAAEFSGSRAVINDGIRRTLAALDLSAVLDVGCGDGRVSGVLPADCRYLGLDFSAKLIGRAALSAPHPFVLADLSHPLPIAPHSFPTVVCYAVMHHLPGPLRQPLMHSLASVLRPGGKLALSVWRFTHSARMRRKIAQDLGNNDYLLTWKTGGRSLRYVHQFDDSEIERLAHQASLSLVDIFYSDSHSNDLSLYAIFTAR